MRRTSTKPQPVNSKGSNGAAEREQYNPLRGWLALCVFDLLSRTNIAVGSDLPITSWMVRQRGMVVESFSNWISRWKDGVCTTVRKTLRITCSYLSLKRVMWKDPTLQPGEVEKQLGCMVCGWGDHRRATPHVSLWNARVGIVCRRQNATIHIWVVAI